MKPEMKKSENILDHWQYKKERTDSVKECAIEKADSGQRLDKYLKKYLKEATGGFIYKMLRKKNIKLISFS